MCCLFLQYLLWNCFDIFFLFVSCDIATRQIQKFIVHRARKKSLKNFTFSRSCLFASSLFFLFCVFFALIKTKSKIINSLTFAHSFLLFLFFISCFSFFLFIYRESRKEFFLLSYKNGGKKFTNFFSELLINKKNLFRMSKTSFSFVNFNFEFTNFSYFHFFIIHQLEFSLSIFINISVRFR